jgi:putative SOS response-associated peptidase YedK
MCYKVATKTVEKLEEALKPKGIKVNSYSRYFAADGFDRPLLPVLSNDSPKEVKTARWKLIPYWVKTEADAKSYANTLNAKCETLFETKTYAPYIAKNRCLLLIDGFFEPNHPQKGVTVPFYITALEDSWQLALGCTYADWVNTETGEVTRTFSVITTPANELMSEIHNVGLRMPLIIVPEKWDQWLSPMAEQEIKAMMQPLADGLLKAHAVSGLVYKKGVNANVPEAIMPYKATLF